MAIPDLSVVIVNWKVRGLVAALLESIELETSGIVYEIFVVDNASGDGIENVVAAFRRKHPRADLTFIQNGDNLGFAAANNIAIRLSKGRVVVLLNPDTEVKDGALQKMVAWMDAHPDAGIAGPRLLNADGTTQPSVRRFPMLLDQILILLKIHHLLPSLPPFKHYFAADFDYEKEQDVDQVMGAAFFVRREVFDRIGLFDERFFIWFEEVDFCKRAAAFLVSYVPSVRILHRGGQSFAQAMTLTKQLYFSASMRTYFKKHRGDWTPVILALPALAGLLAAGTFSLWKTLRRGK